ncbi:MAG: protein-export chaperone SecB [Pseudomonadota bacterium]
MSESQANPQFLIKSQYIKDLSFENPNLPGSVAGQPQINLDIDLKAGRIDDEHFELVMHISAKAVSGETPLFIAELDYAAIAMLQNIPEDRLEQVLFIDCAFLLFPFARRVISDITRDGGFPPLLIEPIDFASLYLKNRQTSH